MKKRLQDNRGFTMMEMLVAVGILVILATIGLSFGSASQSLQQYALDEKAQSIYTLAQNRLTAMYFAGQTELFSPDEALGVIVCEKQPSDWAGEAFARGNLLCLSSESAAASILFSAENLELSGIEGHWLVEYEPASGLVYAVFYSEEMTDFSESSDLVRLGHSQRVDCGATVGYYGGNAA